jgi:hypothetical protein
MLVLCSILCLGMFSRLLFSLLRERPTTHYYPREKISKAQADRAPKHTASQSLTCKGRKRASHPLENVPKPSFWGGRLVVVSAGPIPEIFPPRLRVRHCVARPWRDAARRDGLAAWMMMMPRISSKPNRGQTEVPGEQHAPTWRKKKLRSRAGHSKRLGFSARYASACFPVGFLCLGMESRGGRMTGVWSMGDWDFGFWCFASGAGTHPPLLASSHSPSSYPPLWSSATSMSSCRRVSE